MLYGELCGDALGSLAALGELYSAHVAERAEWGKAEPAAREALRAQLDAVSALIHTSQAAAREGVALSPPPPGLDVAEAAASALAAGKARKTAIDAETVERLQGACRGAGNEGGRGVTGGGSPAPLVRLTQPPHPTPPHPTPHPCSAA